MVLPSRASVCMSALKPTAAFASSPSSGSSKNTTGGLCSNAAVMTTLRRMPFEYAPSNLSVKVSKLRSKNAMNCWMRARAASCGIAYRAATISRYSNPVRDSNTAPDSGTKPTRRFTSSGSRRRSKPQIVAVPWEGSIMPVSIFRVVDFPAPFGPRNPTICPAGTSNESESTAVCAPNRLVRCWREIISSCFLMSQPGCLGDEKANPLACPDCQAVCQPFDGLALLGLMASIGLIAKHQAQQPIHQTCATVGSAHGDVRHDAHVAFAHDLHELHHGVALRAE